MRYMFNLTSYLMFNFLLCDRWEGGTKDSWFSHGARKTHSFHWNWWRVTQFTTKMNSQARYSNNLHLGAWFSLWKRIWQSSFWIQLTSFFCADLFNIYAATFSGKTEYSTNSLLGMFAFKGLSFKVKWYTTASLVIAYQVSPVSWWCSWTSCSYAILVGEP